MLRLFIPQLKILHQGFIQALSEISLPEIKLNLKLSFETQYFKPKNKKVIKTV